MTYRLVFDVSERIPDALMLLPALAGLVSLVVLLVRPSWRQWLRWHSWLWLVLAALLWTCFEVHDVGGSYGLLFSFPALVMLGAAALVLRVGGDYAMGWDRRFGAAYPVNPKRKYRVGSVALIASAVSLAVVALGAQGQISAFDLQRQLSNGQATVVTGVVENSKNQSWAYQCFTVAARRFCYDDGPTSVGFHQSWNNGGPIHDGLHVRVTYIGDVIVRLEIADEPPDPTTSPTSALTETDSISRA